MPQPPRYDFRPSQFPISIRYFRTDTNELVHTQLITRPGQISIEPWAKIVGAPIRVEVEFADGKVLESQDPSAKPLIQRRNATAS